MSKFNDQVNFWAHMLDESMNEASADDILARWNARQTEHKPVASDKASAAPIQPKRFISYSMGNDTHELYAGDWIFGMYMQKDEMYASYAIYRMSKLTVHKFKSLKGKTQTSTLKTFLTNNAELIEKDEHGRWTLDKFIDEMKRLVGPSYLSRQPVLFTAGLKRTNYHYDRNAAHRGKTTMTTQTSGHITYDLDNFKFDASTFEVHSGRSKQSQMTFGGSGGKLPTQKEDPTYSESEADASIGSKTLPDLIYQLIDGTLQQLLTFGDEFYDVEVLNDLTLKFVVGGDAVVDAHHASNDDFDDYSVLRVDSDVESNLLDDLCKNINSLLSKNRIDISYSISKDSLDLASRSVYDSAQQEYMSTGRTNVRYACDVMLKVKR